MVAANEHPRVPALRRAQARAAQRVGAMLMHAQASEAILMPSDQREAAYCGSLLGQAVGSDILFRYVLLEVELFGVDAGRKAIERVQSTCADFLKRLDEVSTPKVVTTDDPLPGSEKSVPPGE